MEKYVKPLAELIKFEAEDILLEMQGDIGEGPSSVEGDIEDW